jgi:hypothetical protein
LLKKNPPHEDGKVVDHDTINDSGEIDDLYQYLEQSGSHYVSLFAHIVREECEASQADSPCEPSVSDSPRKTVLFNETQLGDMKGQEDVGIAVHEEQDMLHVLLGHQCLPPVADSQEMMVGIAYAMPYEVQQFQLFHVCMHADGTADSNKEGCPLVTVLSKDSYCKMFIVIHAFLPTNEQSWSYKWFFQTIIPALLGKDAMKRIKIIVTEGDSQKN